jgi:hypothetical protein
MVIISTITLIVSCCVFAPKGRHQLPATSGLLISSFNGKPQASAFRETVAYGLPLKRKLDPSD